MQLNLVVIRSSDMKSLAGFYSTLFNKELELHRHGNGPEHYGTELDGLIFEIYPKRSESDDTSAMRFGYIVENVDSAITRVQQYPINIVSEAKDSPWGRRAVIDDPEGHRIELTQS